MEDVLLLPVHLNCIVGFSPTTRQCFVSVDLEKRFAIGNK